VLAVVLSLLASACWGVADFTGGLQSRRVPVVVVLAIVEGVGLLAVLVVIAVTGEAVPGTRAILFAVGAGTAGAVALGCFYRALAIGTMSIVAPISSTGVALPVIVGIATGDRPSLLVSLGLVVAVVGVLLASREQHDDAEQAAAGRAAVWLALVAAAGFGSYFVFSDVAADSSVPWLLVFSRVLIVPVLIAVALVRRAPAPARASLLVLALAGLLDVSATGLYGLANTKGALSIVSVVGALYPVATVLLARVVLGERIRPLQQLGVAAAMLGVALIATG
jgi:drug/metabolite transporter (DMT)-like permease